MRLSKSITFLFLTANLSCAYAAVIHTTQINNMTYNTVNADVRINVGYAVGEQCIVQKSYLETHITLLPQRTMPLELESESLLQSAGADYTCIDRAIKTEFKTMHDIFNLYSQNHLYSGTSPYFNEIKITE